MGVAGVAGGVGAAGGVGGWDARSDLWCTMRGRSLMVSLIFRLKGGISVRIAATISSSSDSTKNRRQLMPTSHEA